MTTSSANRVPFGVVLALLAGLQACRAREGDRCICAEDCRDGLSCVAEGRVLTGDECAPVVGEDANPGVCVDEDEAAEDDGGGGAPEVFMDLGSKRDFDPGVPPEPATGSGSGSETGAATMGSSSDGASSSSGNSSSGSSSGSSGASSSSGSSSSGSN